MRSPSPPTTPTPPIATPDPWARRALLAVAGPVGRRLFRVRIEGHEHLPATGRAIIAANHLSFFDSVVLALAVPRPLSFVGKAEYARSWRTRRLFPALGMVPVERGSPRRSYRALDVVAGALEADQLFALYPEGTRSRDGHLHEGHRGVGHLSVVTGAAVIPTGIIGTDRIQPRGTRVPRPFRPAVVRFGSPIDPSVYHGSRRERRRGITRDVMAAIGSLSGQTRPGSVAARA